MKKLLLVLLFLFKSNSLIADNLSDSNKLFDWAETKYPQFFSYAAGETFELLGYIARYYPETDTYLGTQDNQVYVYGDVFNGLLYVGELDEFLAIVNSEANNISMQDYLPLQVGNTWDVLIYSGNQFSGFSRHQIIGTEEINAVTVFQDAYLGEESELEDAALLAFQDNQLFYFGDRQFQADANLVPGLYQFNPAINIPADLTVGDQFAGNSQLLVPQGAAFELNWSFHLKAHVDQVPLRSGMVFDDCISFVLTRTALSETSRDMLWFCKDIGQIKAIDLTNGDTEELVDFELVE